MSELVSVYIDEDEWYPVWEARVVGEDDRKPYDDTVQVTRDQAERWARVFAEFEKVQGEIAAASRNV